MRPVRLALIVGFGLLLVLMVGANRVLGALEHAAKPDVPACLDLWEMEGSFAEPSCKGRIV